MIVCPKISIFVLRFFGGARFNMYLGVLYIFNQYTRHLTQLQFQGRSTSVFNSISCPKPWTLQKTQGPRFQTCPRRWRFLLFWTLISQFQSSRLVVCWPLWKHQDDWGLALLDRSLCFSTPRCVPTWCTALMKATLMWMTNTSGSAFSLGFGACGGLRRLVTWMGWVIWWCSGSLGDVFYSHPPKVQDETPSGYFPHEFTVTKSSFTQIFTLYTLAAGRHGDKFEVGRYCLLGLLLV